jgi:hypothetical protein
MDFCDYLVGGWSEPANSWWYPWFLTSIFETSKVSSSYSGILLSPWYAPVEHHRKDAILLSLDITVSASWIS